VIRLRTIDASGVSRRVLTALIAAIPAISSGQPTAPVDSTAYARARSVTTPHNRASIAFTIPRKDLFAENVAYDQRDGSFYVGSTRHGSVTRRTRSGVVSEFVPGGRDTPWMVVGMKVDSPRGWLWVNGSGASNSIRHSPAEEGKAGLLRYDLASGRLLKRYIPRESGDHFFNDIVIARDGAAYVTDMSGGAIYRVLPGADTLEVWAKPAGMTLPNGLALSGDGRTLFVALPRAITALDIGTRESRVLDIADSVDVAGIDGLYWHSGALIGVQGGRRNRIQRFHLDPAGRRIISADILEAHHPMFMHPSTGVVVGEDLFVIANSQFSSFLRDGVPFPSERLFETVILRVPLAP